MDVLGFLAFESVRSLCVAALEIRDAAAGVKRVDVLAALAASGDKRGRVDNKDEESKPEKDTEGEANEDEGTIDVEKVDNKVDDDQGMQVDKDNVEDQTASTLVEQKDEASTNAIPAAATANTSTSNTNNDPIKSRAKSPPPEPWKAPPTLPLLPAHLLTAYSRLQRNQAGRKAGGLRNWRGGVKRSKIALI
jgi:transcription initiation protein SPT3